MKKIKTITQKSWPLILALIFLSSCYEIVYVTQDKDVQPFTSTKTKVCINVTEEYAHPKDPYFGILMPESWKVKAGIPYSFQKNGISVKIGTINYSSYYSKQMELIDPAPPGYVWWVGVGDTKIKNKGIYNAHPEVYAGCQVGDYQLEYMMGDSYNGLNYLRSEKKDVRVVVSRAATDLIANSDHKSIQLHWEEPFNSLGLVGYDVYRNNKKINTGIVLAPEYVDESITTGSFSYTVVPLYLHGLEGMKSIPADICFAHRGTSMDFDGMNDKVVVFDDPSLHLEQKITIEAWIKLKETDSYQPRIISKGLTGVDYELFLDHMSPEYKLGFSLAFGTLQSNMPLTTKNWYHIAATYDGHYMKLYINGKLDCQRKIYGHITISEAPLYIGRKSSAPTNYFCGDIDAVRVWNTCRTEEQINFYDNMNLNGSEEGLVGNWQMSEGCSFTTGDMSKEKNNGYLVGSCWCSEEFPYIEETNSLTNPELKVPVMNYMANNKRPEKIVMEFKINPKVLKFQGIIKENTQIRDFSKVLTQYSQDGTIRITALNYKHAMMEGDVLVYIDVKSLQPKVNTTLEFQSCNSDGIMMRTMSAKVVADAAGWTSDFLTDVNTTLQTIGIHVYPNPAKNYVNVEINNANAQVFLQIVNVAGQEVYSETISAKYINKIHQIDLSQFTKGLYIINLRHENEMSVKKFAVH